MSRSDLLSSGWICLLVAVVFLTGLVQLGVRLKRIQVDGAASYSYASARQSIRRVQTAGNRGRILDRRGSVLAENRSAVSIVCHPSRFQRRTWEETTEAIGLAIGAVSEVIGRSPEISKRSIRRHVNQSLAMPLVVFRGIDDRELAVFAEHEFELPGFAIAETDSRIYPNGALAAHLLGYVGRDRGDAQAGDEKFSFSTPEMKGRSGLEAYYNGFLRGVSGERKLLVDARGFAIREWTVVEARPGPDLRLTIDIGLQRVAEDQLAGCRGACVALDPRTGEVLALASAPGFDPNRFMPFLAQEVYEELIDDSAKPLLNRATGGAYAPGSTFKPITALAGLRLGVPVDIGYRCNGAFELGELRLRCANAWGHGEVDMLTALMKSCNPYFCNLGMDVGTNALVGAAREFGLGSRTGIDLGVDIDGRVPTGDWKVRAYGERWYQGDLAQMAIGQGMLLASPLQMACVAGAIGTGYLVTPHLKSDVPVCRRRLAFSDEHLRIVREGMRMVVAGSGDQRGTGWRGGEGVSASVSGKTGTAEIGRGATLRKNAWFVAFAPSDDPRIAVSLLIENGESGGGTAAPKVANILRYVFNGR